MGGQFSTVEVRATELLKLSCPQSNLPPRRALSTLPHSRSTRRKSFSRQIPLKPESLPVCRSCRGVAKPSSAIIGHRKGPPAPQWSKMKKSCRQSLRWMLVHFLAGDFGMVQDFFLRIKSITSLSAASSERFQPADPRPSHAAIWESVSRPGVARN